MASALFAGAVLSCAVTELIREVIDKTKSAKKCKSECRKLEVELNAIKPDVEDIGTRLEELRTRACNTEHKDIKMVEAWLERLKGAIELADIEVHKCNSSRLHFDHKLSGKITSMYHDIRNVAANRVQLFLQLGHLIPKEPSQHGAPLNSSHNAYGYPNSGYFSQDSSLHYGNDSSGSSNLFGEDSSVHSSSSGYEISGTDILRQMSQERNYALQREDETRSSMGHFDPHLQRRHTIGGFHVTQPLPHVQSHHKRTSYPSW